MGEMSLVRQIDSRGGGTGPTTNAAGLALRAARSLAAVSLLFGCTGCAMTLPSLWERTNTAPPRASQMSAAQAAADADPVTTGSVRRPAAAPQTITPQQTAAAGTTLPIPPADWEAAKGRLMEALADTADTPSIPWENAASGMRGTVTALQRGGGANGQTCRDFLGSAIKDGKEVWFDGRACRNQAGWAVTELRPWRRT